MARLRTSQTSRHDGRVGVGAVGLFGVSVLAIMFVASTLVLAGAIVELWPPECPAETDQATDAPAPDESPAPTPAATPGEPSTAAGVCPEDAHGRTQFAFWGLNIAFNREQNLLVLVTLLGAFGSMGHVLRSFFRYVGERKLVWSWVLMYLLTPLVGSIFAVLTYIILRAGLLGSTEGAVVGNTWGFAAIAALVGLFSAQAAAKLKQVFETLFSAAEQGADSLEPAFEEGLVITGFVPPSASVGDTVEIQGEGLQSVRTVRFEGPVDAPAAYDDRKAVLRAVVPNGAVTGPLTVVLGNETATSDAVLTIT